jgi:preprotein translocase subunit SecG
MGILSGVLLVVFIIVAILLVLLVLVQDEEGDSLGGVFAGGSSSAFGSRSGNVLTKATSIIGGLFLVLSFGLALLNKTPSGSGVESAARELSTDGNRDWWKNNDSSEAPLPTDSVVIPEPVSASVPTDSVTTEPVAAPVESASSEAATVESASSVVPVVETAPVIEEEPATEVAE